MYWCRRLGYKPCHMMGPYGGLSLPLNLAKINKVCHDCRRYVPKLKEVWLILPHLFKYYKKWSVITVPGRQGQG